MIQFQLGETMQHVMAVEDLEANSIEILKGQLTSLLSFLVLKSEFFSTVNLNREVN